MCLFCIACLYFLCVCVCVRILPCLFLVDFVHLRVYFFVSIRVYFSPRVLNNYFSKCSIILRGLVWNFLDFLVFIMVYLLLTFSNEEIFPINELVIAFFSSPVIKLAVPSAVFSATFPVNPSETMTLTSPSIKWLPSM